MLLANLSLAGWLHSAACVIALLAGAWNLVMPKGTPAHRRVGRCYVYAMLVANLSVLAIYHFDIGRFRPFTAGAGIFGIFHWEAMATLLLLALGVYAAPRQSRRPWAYMHPVSMLLTYYMLIGGLINEIFVRVTLLRDYAKAHAPASLNVAMTPLVGRVQGTAMLLFVILLLYHLIKVARHRRQARNNGAAAQAAV